MDEVDRFPNSAYARYTDCAFGAQTNGQGIVSLIVEIAWQLIFSPDDQLQSG